MRAVAMRVLGASVSIDGICRAQIERGQLALIGFGRDDEPKDVQMITHKLHALRIFEDATGRLRHTADELGFSHLLVPQFTLYGDVRNGNRPGFTSAMPPAEAEAMWQRFLAGFGQVEHGVFGADMQVELVNDGPVTIIIDSKKLF